MEENGKMDNTYIKYLGYRDNLRTLLELGDVTDYDVREVTSEILTKVMGYLTSELLSLDTTDLKEKIEKTLEIAESGNTKILGGDVKSLIKEITGEEETDSDKFIFVWANFFGALKTRLLIQHASLFYTPNDVDCPCSCSKGDLNWDSYTSGVYPGEEEKETVETTITNPCDCNYRIL